MRAITRIRTAPRPRYRGSLEAARAAGVAGAGCGAAAFGGGACPSVSGAGAENICVNSPGAWGVAGRGAIGCGVAKDWVAPPNCWDETGGAGPGREGTSFGPKTRVNSPTWFGAALVGGWGAKGGRGLGLGADGLCGICPGPMGDSKKRVNSPGAGFDEIAGGGIAEGGPAGAGVIGDSPDGLEGAGLGKGLCNI